MRLAAILVMTSLTASCGGVVEGACTLIGCTDGWTLRLQAAESLQPGVYGLTTTVDGVDTLCSWEVRLACDGGGACIVDGDCANAVYTPSEVAVSFENSPDSVDVALTRGGLRVVNETVVPPYKTVRPNGPDCEPECRQAVVAVVVP